MLRSEGMGRSKGSRLKGWIEARTLCVGVSIIITLRLCQDRVEKNSGHCEERRQGCAAPAGFNLDASARRGRKISEVRSSAVKKNGLRRGLLVFLIRSFVFKP